MLLQPPINSSRLAAKAKLTGPHARRAGQAFTLVELLLATALTLLLGSAIVFSFASLLRSTELEESTGRLETLIRFARAQAAYTGRKVQLTFEQGSGQTPDSSGSTIRLSWEPDPLDQPGHFEELSDTAWQVKELSDLVQIQDVQLLASTGAPFSTYSAGDETADENDPEAWLLEPFSPITFYPDGSSDSAEIILASRAPEDERKMAVRIVGLTGSVSHQAVAARENENQADSEQTEEDGTVPEL